MVEEIIGQALGIIATIITFISYQANTKKSVLLILSSAIFCTTLSYFFLGATSGFALNIVCLIRNAGKSPLLYIECAKSEVQQKYQLFY